MTRRDAPVVNLARPNMPPELRGVVGELERTVGKTTALADILLLADFAGYTIVDAATTPGTAITASRTHVDFSDAGADQCRLVARGHAGAAGSVVVLVYDVTNSKELCRVTLTDGVATTMAGAWTNLTPSGSDHEVELRVIGNGTLDPTLYRVSLQLRTLRAGSGQPGVA
jgi:hypothetical protein